MKSLIELCILYGALGIGIVIMMYVKYDTTHDDISEWKKRQDKTK